MSDVVCPHAKLLGRYHQEHMQYTCVDCGVFVREEPWNYHSLPVVRTPEYDRSGPRGGPRSTENRVLLEAAGNDTERRSSVPDARLGSSEPGPTVPVDGDLGEVDGASSRTLRSGVRRFHPTNGRPDRTELDEAINGQDHWTDPVEDASIRRRLRSVSAGESESRSEDRRN